MSHAFDAYLSPIPQNLVLEDPVTVILSYQKCFDHITEKLWISWC